MEDGKGICKIIFIIYEVFKFLNYKDLINIQLVNKSFYKFSKEFELFISKKYINNLPRILKYENTMKYQIQKCFSQFPVNTFKIHMYNVLIDIGFNDGFGFNGHDPQEIIIIMDFTYFYQNRYHRIKIYEDYTDDSSANGINEICKVCYSVPGFNITYYEEIHYYESLEIEDNFKLLPKWSGFLELQNFDKMFYLLWGKSNDKYKLFAGIYDDINDSNGINIIRIDSTMNINELETENSKIQKFRKKCDIWLNNLEETFNYENENRNN
jgi:hypothetical protein